MRNAESTIRRAIDAAEELADLGNLLALNRAVRNAKHTETNPHPAPAVCEDTVSERVVSVAMETARFLKQSAHGDGAVQTGFASIRARLKSLCAEIENLCVSPFRHNNGKHPAYSPVAVARHCDQIAKGAEELHQLLAKA
jgi:hypothetical protein